MWASGPYRGGSCAGNFSVSNTGGLSTLIAIRFSFTQVTQSIPPLFVVIVGDKNMRILSRSCTYPKTSISTPYLDARCQ